MLVCFATALLGCLQADGTTNSQGALDAASACSMGHLGGYKLRSRRTRRSSAGYTDPVGLEGLQRMSKREAGVMAASNCEGWSRKPSEAFVSTITARPPASDAMLG